MATAMMATKKAKDSKKKKRKAKAAAAEAAEEQQEEAPAMATEALAPAAAAEEEEEEAAGSAKKAKKKKKKQSKKRRRDAEVGAEGEGEPDEAAGVAEAGVATDASAADGATGAPAAADAARRKSDRAARRSAKESERARLLALIPAEDPDGIPYGKIQIRRMMRRVKHGLDPIATEEEEREMRERAGRERREEEALYANAGDDGDEAGGGDGEDEGGAGGGEDEGEGDEAVPSPRPPPLPRKKKRPRSKPVPSDYVCAACRNECPDFAPHWIYDCPMKRTERGCNKVAKRLRGLNEPDGRKVFVSGLPFDCDEGGVERFFAEGVDGGEDEDEERSSKPIHCKLLRFEDSKRCKGQAFLTFASDAGATRALTLNGSPWRDVEEPGTSRKTKKGKKKDEKEDGGRKELRLKVTRVLNRRATKARGKTSK